MASRKTSYYDTYVDGNTVRTIETLPQEEPAVRRKKRRQAKVHYSVLYKEKTRTHALYAAFLTCIMGLLVFGCVRYLQIQSRVTASMENINKLESTLNDLKAENDAEYNRVMSSVDLETVRKIATEELGMVYADENQVVLYDSKDTDYVRQYQDVPKTSAESGVKSKAAALFGK